MTWHPRSDWTKAPKGGTVLAGTGRVITTIYIHFPGAGPRTIGTASPRARLEGYRRYHKGTQGWADIAYNLAVDQRGDVWELRGIDRQSGANGGTRSNRHGMAVLVLVGDNEEPTAACIAGIKDAVRRIRAQHPKARAIKGHQESPDASTDCPGEPLMRLVRAGALEPGRVTATAGGTSTPTRLPAPDVPAKGLVVDGRFGTATVEALQAFLNAGGRGGARIVVDGKAGPATWRALQRYLGTPVDGKVSSQSYKPAELGNGITGGWEYTGRGSSGSTMVRALQKWIKVPADGVWGPATTKGLQVKLREHGA